MAYFLSESQCRVAGLQSGEGHIMMESAVWAQYINVTDRQTDSHVVTAIAALTYFVRAAKQVLFPVNMQQVISHLKDVSIQATFAVTLVSRIVV